MKKVLMLLLVGIMITGLSAQMAASFRNQSTGGVLDDELDMMFNGIDLSYIKGAHIYTNLSNFEGTDKLFLNQDANHFLVGVASPYPFYPAAKYAMLYKYWDNKNPLSYSYNFTNYAVDAAGDYDALWQSYDDTNGNGLYDRLRSDKLMFSKYQSSNGETFGMNNTWRAKNTIFGLLLGWDQRESGNNYSHGMLNDILISSGTPTYDMNQFTQIFNDNDPNVVTDSLRTHYAVTFDNSNKDKMIFGKLGIAFVSGAREFLIEPSLAIVDDKIFSSEEALIETLTSTTYNHEKYSSTDTDEGIEGKLAFTYRLNKDKALNIKTGNFMQVGVYGGYTNLDSKSLVMRERHENAIISLNGESTIDNNSSVMSEGTKDGTVLGAKMKVQGTLGKNAFWGMGLDYSIQDETYDFTYSSGYTNVQDDTDSGVSFMRSTESSMLKGKGTTENVVETLVIPTGLEYWFSANQKWALRCGSVFTQTNTHVQEKLTPISSEPVTTEVVDAAGNVSVTIADNEYSSTVTNTKTKISSSVMTYGFGFKANDNLQIDLMGVFDTADVDVINTDFFRSLRLSFSYHF